MTYLENKRATLETLYERTDLPLNLLRDPCSWFEADDMEQFLVAVDQEFGKIATKDEFIAEVGYACVELRGWGALDSVLRLMQNPWDIYRQPERIFSYFVSPAPPLRTICSDSESISFEVPISSEQFPFVSRYLCAAIETLPQFVGKTQGSVAWEGNELQIRWSNCQKSLFEDEPEASCVRPKLLKNLLSSVEQSQQALEEKTRELFIAKKELERQTHRQKEAQSSQRDPGVQDQVCQPLGAVLQNVWKMRDYMARSQQLVTLLIGQDRMNSQVQEAMRRVNWNSVCSEYSKIIDETAATLERVRKLTGGTEEKESVKDHSDHST